MHEVEGINVHVEDPKLNKARGIDGRKLKETWRDYIFVNKTN